MPACDAAGVAGAGAVLGAYSVGHGSACREGDDVAEVPWFEAGDWGAAAAAWHGEQRGVGFAEPLPLPGLSLADVARLPGGDTPRLRIVHHR